MSKVAIIGYGYVGKAYHKMFPDAVIYDEPQRLFIDDNGVEAVVDTVIPLRRFVHECDLALVCVPTPAKNGQLDTSIVEDVVSWLETDLILIKSALQPGTVDRLVEQTGKLIAVSVELIGEGKYSIPYWKYPHPTDPTLHQTLIIGGEDDTARRCADVLWSRMSPDIDIHLTTAIEAEVTKLMENAWGAMKVTFANTMYDICGDLGANYTRVLQAWGSDGRVEKMHMRVVPGKRGWGGKCYTKDVPALAALDASDFLKAVVKANERHRAADD